MPGPEHSGAATTVAGARRWAIAALREAGIESAAVDVRRLMAEATGLAEANLLAGPELPLAPAHRQIFLGYIERRCAREPVSRIIGRQEFYGRTFAVSAATLDPRPESETLIEAACGLVRAEGWNSMPLRVLDVGTGSGCLLVSLLCEFPHATGLGTDVSPAALEAAEYNALSLGVAGRASWQQADVLENAAGPFHILVSNPPYVRSADIDALEPEVARYDPLLALDGGPDGLAVFRKLAARAGEVVPEGWIVLEVGYDQADIVAELLTGVPNVDTGTDVRFFRDVAGRRRCVAVRTRN